jgi:pyrroline-5-carboxylate reductase
MEKIAFIGGGNMASAIISGLLRQGRPVSTMTVVEPHEPQRAKLRDTFGVTGLGRADASLSAARIVVWAVKPQSFVEAAFSCAAYVQSALQLSVMAGIRTDAIGRATATTRVIRAMPNTPALIGMGIAALYAPRTVTPAGRTAAESILAATGETLWVEHEADLDAVTALSGSGPAYVFYFVEAMMQAAEDMGLTAEQARRLALGTFAGATALARSSPEPPSVLRERVTSKGGTTHAALAHLESAGVKAAFVAAMKSAQRRAGELGDEFGLGTPPV